MLLCLWLLTLSAVVVFGSGPVFIGSTVALGIWRQKHHWYWGVLGWGAGALCFLPGWTWLAALGALLCALGAVSCADDAWQHARQEATGDRAYRSPLHRWFYRVFPGLSRY